MHRRTCAALLTALTAVLVGASAWALPPAGACQLGKLKATREHLACRLGAHVKAEKSGETPDFSRCDARLATAWRRAERAGAGQCPSSNDRAAIQAFIGLCTDGVATALAGGSLPACAITPASVRSSPAQQPAPSKWERLKLKSA